MLAVFARYLALALAVVVLNFAIPRLLPGDPLDFSGDDGTNAAVSPLSSQSRARLREYYYLDAPVGEQFRTYLVDLARLDLGWSIARSTPVAQLIRERLLWTLGLTSLAFLVATTVGTLLGLVATWAGGAAERLIIGASTALAALPEFLIAMALLLAFSVTLRWLPAQGGQTLFAASTFGAQPNTLSTFADILRHLTLPALALTLATTSSVVLLTAGSTRSVYHASYLTTARAKGLPESVVALRHGLPNAVLPILTFIGLRVGQALGGAIVIERVFAIPGLGLLAFEGIRTRDYPVVQAVFLVGSLGVLLANFTVELLYARYGRRLEG